ncbi:MAG: hypothetical protein U5L72_18895 [Bacteroidales bacterium]|nr:hypothetical protein [Bacteroidales bacterium]
MSRFLVLSGEVCEMVQFWQLRHARLQPAVAMEKDADPGRKWIKRFLLDGVDVRGTGIAKGYRIIVLTF